MINKLVFALASVLATLSYASEPFVIFDGNANAAPKQPQACASEDGTVHLTFGVGEQVYYCRMEGDKASAPQSAFTVPNLSLGMRRGPRIAKAGKSIVISAIGGKQGKGKDGDVLAYQSLDEGKSWTGPLRVNDVESSAREGLHAMTSTPSGVLWCVWLDLREKGTQLFASQSIDQGQSWSKNIRVYRSPDGSICECCHPSIVANGDSVHVLFRNSLAGNRDMYISSSQDHGKSFGEAMRLGSQHWNLNACPMDGGMLAIGPDGEVVTAWRRAGIVYATKQDATDEQVIGTGEQPWITTNSNGTYVVWTSKKEGELLLSRTESAAPEKLSENARDPVIVSLNGAKPFVQVFWEQRSGNNTAIMGHTIR